MMRSARCLQGAGSAGPARRAGASSAPTAGTRARGWTAPCPAATPAAPSARGCSSRAACRCAAGAGTRSSGPRTCRPRRGARGTPAAHGALGQRRFPMRPLSGPARGERGNGSGRTRTLPSGDQRGIVCSEEEVKPCVRKETRAEGIWASGLTWCGPSVSLTECRVRVFVSHSDESGAGLRGPADVRVRREKTVTGEEHSRSTAGAASCLVVRVA